MADQPMPRLHLASDERLETALRSMADDIAWPAAAPTDGAPDIAALVAARLDGTRRAAPGTTEWGPRWTWRPATRALVIALVVLLALAALVGAAGLGLPGLRIIFGGPEPSPTAPAVPSASKGVGAVGSSASPSAPTGSTPATAATLPGPLGTGLGLGMEVDASAVDALAGFHVPRPSNGTIGPPDATWIDGAHNEQVALVWASSGRLPETTAPGIGLIEMAFRGKIDEGWFKKIVGDRTKVETVTVNGHRGFWISGEPHQFFYESPNGFVDEPRRWVGDALLWSDGPITYRLETSLGRDAAIAVAESMR
jgi:hypothetical protein